MHPAPSIIVFTVLSGLGYGLAAMLGLGLLDPAALATKAAHVLALALIAAGLLSSTFHLGNPQRAWRALSQWRTSWLSREGVLAVATFIPLTVSAVLAVFFGRYSAVAGLLGAVGAAVTVYCTSMIYASLKSVAAWHTPLTSVCFLLFAASGGLTASAAFGFASGNPVSGVLALAAIAATLAAWAVKLRWRRRLNATPGSGIASATGLGHLGAIRLFEPPHITDNYLTKEMVFRIGRKHADKLFLIALAFGSLLSALLLFAAWLSGPGLTGAFLAFAALASGMLGVFIERWLFFAEARHAVAAYYGS